MFRQFTHLAALVCVGLLSASPLRADAVLIMFEEVGCAWCAEWNRAIAPIYPKSAEGRAAPLLRANIHDAPPAGILLSGRVTYTPTFVLVDKGQEIGRIEGYPGEDFFWGLLSRMLKEAGVTDDRSG